MRTTTTNGIAVGASTSVADTAKTLKDSEIGNIRMQKVYLRKLLLAVLLFSFVLLAVACDRKCPVPSDTNVRHQIPSTGEVLGTDIYLDGTASMVGFTRSDGFLSNYQQTIPMLERTARGTVAFWRFGNEPVSINRDDYLRADKPVFYPNSAELKETRIQNVLDTANPEHLTIVVTDLFQEFADINRLIGQIRQKFIEKNLAVGILGIKSQYDGTVYDVGTNDKDFRYTSGSDPKRFRPFYIIAFGSYGSVSDYFDRFDQESKSFESYDNKETGFSIKRRLIISRYLVEKPADLLEATVKTNDKVARSASGILVQTNTTKNPFREFTVKKEAEGEAFTATVPLKHVPSGIEFEDDLSTNVKGTHCGDAVGDIEGEMPITVSSKLDFNRAISISVSANGRKLSKDVTSCFQITVRPKSYRLPSWITEWNMTGEQVEAWGKVPAEFDGGRTHNLYQFLQSLWQSNAEVHELKLAEFYCYFKVK